MSRTVILLFTLAALGRAAVLNIPYAGGMQTGTFDLKGTYAAGSIPGADYPDTVVIDGGLRIASFTAEPIPGRMCNGNFGYWMFVGGTAGVVGVKSPQDTVWTAAAAFPAGPLSLDSLSPAPDPIVPSASFPYNLHGTARGLQIGVKKHGGSCYGIGFDPAPGYNRVLYFRLDGPGGTRYGKLMAHAHEVYVFPSPPLTDGLARQLKRVQIAYTISSSTDLNSGSVVGVAPARAAPASAGRTLVWSEREGVLIRGARGRLYDLQGKRRIPKSAPYAP